MRYHPSVLGRQKPREIHVFQARPIGRPLEPSGVYPDDVSAFCILPSAIMDKVGYTKIFIGKRRVTCLKPACTLNSTSKCRDNRKDFVFRIDCDTTRSSDTFFFE